MRSKPRRDICTAAASTRETHDQFFLLVSRGDEDDAVQVEEHRHRGMADPLVAIDERMVLNQRGTQGRRFVDQGWVKIVTLERGAGLSDGRVERPRSRMPVAPPLDSITHS